MRPHITETPKQNMLNINEAKNNTNVLVQPLVPAIQPEEEFENDIKSGLTKKRKVIPSKYFYDKKGSELFNEITKLPTYYLTTCETEILQFSKENLANLLPKDPFNLIELGPGEGFKTEILIEHFLNKNKDFTYLPIDISEHYLNALKDSLQQKYKNLQCSVINLEFLAGLRLVNLNPFAKNLVLFLGSSIGNLRSQEAQLFLKEINQVLHTEDFLLIGFDLRKDISKMMQAYDDPITQQFNFNLLDRINKELEGNFKLQQFSHLASYNKKIHSMESRLVSLAKQEVFLKKLNLLVNFDKNESIHVEYSHKYALAQIQDLAYTCGYQIVYNFFDSKHYFVDSLWQVKKSVF